MATTVKISALPHISSIINLSTDNNLIPIVQDGVTCHIDYQNFLNYHDVNGTHNGKLSLLSGNPTAVGKYLKNTGTDVIWADINSLPSLTGNTGKFLSVNSSETSAVWSNIPISAISAPSSPGIISGNGTSFNSIGYGSSGQVLLSTGSSVTWSTISTVTSGGSTGQVLTKKVDGTYGWSTPPLSAIPSAGVLYSNGSIVNSTMNISNLTLTNPTEAFYYHTNYSPYTIDLSNGSIFSLSVTGAAITVNLPLGESGKSYMILIKNTFGAHSISFAGSANLLWCGGSPPTAGNTLNSYDIYVFVCFNIGSTIYTIGQDGGREAQ